MEQNKHKFRLRLNLFDCIVILIAVAVAGFLLWSRLKPADTAAVPAAEKLRYTICLQKVIDGASEQMGAGDKLVDAVKKYDLGQVVSVEARPATKSIINEEQRCYVTADIPGYEDVFLVVESTAAIGEEKVLVGSGYELHVGEEIFVRGPGYLGSGVVYAMERGN